MRMGATQKKLMTQILADGLELPEHLANSPELPTGQELFYNAFQALTSCRSSGMSLGPIPWTAIDSYCRRYRIVGLQADDMFFYVEHLDLVYRAEVEKKGS